MMNAEHRKLLEQEMVSFLFEGKDVHIEGYTPEDKKIGPLLNDAALIRPVSYAG